MAVGGKLKGALARDPNMQRLSPGVYRNSQGQLVNSAGRTMRRATPRPQQQQAERQDNSWAYQPYVPQQGQDGNQFGQAVGELMGQYPGGRPSPFEIRNPMTGEMVNLPNPMPIDPEFNMTPGSIVNYPGQLNGRNPAEIAGAVAGQAAGMPGNPVTIGGQVGNSAIRLPQMSQMPQMPQPSANNGGRYRLSPGVYGTREQAMRQYQDAMQQAVGQSAPQAMPMQRRR